MHQEQKVSLVGLLVWAVCALFFTYEFLLRTVLGTFQHPIMYDLHLTPFSFAILSTTAYMAIYGIMQIPIGFFVEKYGIKKSLFIAAIICGMSVIGFALTQEFKIALLFRMLMGLGSSFGFICLLLAVYDWMPGKNIGLMIGLSQLIGTMGPMLAAGPLNSLALDSNTPWQSIFLGLGFFGLGLTILILLFVKNNPNIIAKFKIIEKSSSVTSDLTKLLSQKQVWLIAIYSALIYFTIEYLSENEGKAYIELNGYSSRFASYMITLTWLGYAIGCPIIGFLSDLLKRRKLLMSCAALIAFFSIIVIVYYPISRNILIAAFFFLGIGTSGQSIGFAIMAEQCSKSYLAAGLGLNNAIIALLTAINAPIIGWLLDYSKSTATVLSLADYHFGFTFIVILIGSAFLLSTLFIKETFCRTTKEFTVLYYNRSSKE
jgi:MFS family permease